MRQLETKEGRKKNIRKCLKDKESFANRLNLEYLGSSHFT